MLALLVPLARRNHLRLDPDGFTVTTPVLTRSYRWAEVDHFFPVGDGISGSVAFDLAAASPRRHRGSQRLTRRAHRRYVIAGTAKATVAGAALRRAMEPIDPSPSRSPPLG